MSSLKLWLLSFLVGGCIVTCGCGRGTPAKEKPTSDEIRQIGFRYVDRPKRETRP